MVLIADSGSTKCDWHVYNTSGVRLLKRSTKGINPMIHSDDDIEKILRGVKEDIEDEISLVEFYCAGGKDDSSQQRLSRMFRKYFNYAQVQIADDLGMAVKCTNGKPGVVCVLGTGSNSCFLMEQRFTNDCPIWDTRSWIWAVGIILEGSCCEVMLMDICRVI